MIHHASIAERLAFGRPVDPVVDDTPVRVAPRPATALVGRILIATIFLISGVAKLTDPGGTTSYMEAAGIPYAGTLAIVAGIAEIAGGLSILFGFLTRIGALGLFIFMILVNVMMHPFWSFEGQERQMQMVQFVKNLAVMGGLLVLVAFGPGRHSIDKKIREPLQP
jgi:putative oxidoreductase